MQVFINMLDIKCLAMLTLIHYLHINSLVIDEKVSVLDCLSTASSHTEDTNDDDVDEVLAPTTPEVAELAVAFTVPTGSATLSRLLIRLYVKSAFVSLRIISLALVKR